MKKIASLFIFALIVTTGCAGKFKSDVKFNASEPLRIAVLPFAQVGDDGKLTRMDGNLLIDLTAISTGLKETPAQFMQRLVVAELSKASLDLIPPPFVEAELLHAGFSKVGTNPVEPDFDKIYSASPAELCKKILHCDAVMYGKVTEWSRSYYAIQSVSTIGMELKIVSARTGQEIFTSTAQDSDSRGITKGATGFSDLVLEPLKGLDGEIIMELATDVAKKSVAPLQRANRPEFLASPAPVLLASAHSSHNGLLERNKGLTVVALGSGGMQGSFSIGGIVSDVPLVERSSGHYVGEYLPLPSDNFSGQPVSVSLKDTTGRVTTQKIGRSSLSLK